MADLLLMSDADLLLDYARRRAADAFAELVRRYGGLVHGVGLRVTRNPDDAADVAQECFLALAAQAGQIRQPLPAWLHQLARGKAIDALRRRSTRARHEHAAARPESLPLSLEQWGSLRKHLDDAIGQLPEGLRDPLVGAYLLGEPQHRLAERLGVSQGTISRRIEEGVDRLREALAAAGAELPQAAVLAGLPKLAVTDAMPAQVAANLTRIGVSGGGGGGIGLAATAAATTARSGWAIAVLWMAALSLVAAGLLWVLTPGESPPATPPTPSGGPIMAANPPANTPQVQPEPPADLDIVAIDPTMSLWWIDPASEYRVENGQVVVHKASAQAAAFHGWIGGPSWENHHVSLEFMVESDTTPQQPRPGAYDWNVQIAPHNSNMFFQLMGIACNICVNAPEVNGGAFTHISDRMFPPVELGRWYKLDVISDDMQITMLLDGKLLNEARVPTTTRGMLGLLVNFASDAVVRIRNMRVTLLAPEAQQVAESKRNARDNWRRRNAALQAAGETPVLDPWPDAATPAPRVR